MPKMFSSADAAVIWIGLFAQLMGITSIGVARLLERSPSQLAAQAFFLLSLLVVGAATAIAMHSGSGAWLLTGATLPLMVVGATLDLGTQSTSSAI